METFVIDDLTPNTEIAPLAKTPNIRLDISRLSDLSRLPEKVSAGIYSDAETLSAPCLRWASTIHAPSAISVSLPQLTAVAVIYANAATTFSAPRLRSPGHIFVFNAKTLDLPSGV
jgi:hypothetical protein